LENSEAPLQMTEFPGSFLLSQQEVISGRASDAVNGETLSGQIAVEPGGGNQSYQPKC